MIDKTLYKRLRKNVQASIDEQKDRGFIAITPKHFSGPGLSPRVLREAWRYIAKDLGLVDDGTGTGTWTVPGKGFSPAAYMAEVAERLGKK